MSTRTKNLTLSIVAVLIATLIPAIIFWKWGEALIFIVCHTLIRPQFDRQYHNIMPVICRDISAIVFFFGTSFVLPLSMSFLSAIPINYLIGWIGCLKATAEHYEYECQKLRKKYCNDKQILEQKIRQAGLGERDSKIAMMYYYEHKKPKEIWLWLCNEKQYESVEWDSVYQLLWRIGNKLK